MNGKLRQNIILSFRSSFEAECISLLLDSYQALKKKGENLTETNENSITARLVGFMKDNPRRKSWQISIQRENYLDTDDTYEGTTDADESARIDLKYTVWNSSVEHEYHMEAKNIGQQNWVKQSSGIKVDASRLQRRYLETGVANFVSGRYPVGALIAYVLDGITTGVVDQINEILKLDNRENECLFKSDAHGCDFHYVSNHFNTRATILKHFFLNFVS